MLMVSWVTVSKVVTAFELASKARWAMMRSENSAEMFTFEASSAPPCMVPRPDVPETPMVAVPLARVVGGCAVQNHNELVACPASYEVRDPAGRAQFPGEFLQDQVPHHIAVLLIDVSETVDVDQENAEWISAVNALLNA